MNTKEKAQIIANFYQKLADNNNGFKYKNTQIDTSHGPNLDTVAGCLQYFEVNPPKPVKKIIDLSVCIESIDMEFSDNDGQWYTDRLRGIRQDGTYLLRNRDGFERLCRVRQGHWHSWQGGECPIPEGLIIDLIFKDGRKCATNYYYDDSWKWLYNDDDIIAFKITDIDDGYRYEWMEE